MPTYRLTTPGQPDELLEADSARVGEASAHDRAHG